MPGQQHLFIPGPTHIPDRVLRAMHQQSVDHRSTTFPEFVRPLLTSVQTLFDTSGKVAIFPSTGTGGWEAAMTNTVPSGSTLLLVSEGHFANLWAGAATRLGYNVSRLGGSWGVAPNTDQIEEILTGDTGHQVAAVLVVHNETATGVTADLPAIRGAMDAAEHPALLMSDGVSAIGSIPYHHDTWGVDVAVTGSQKGLMMPAGLSLLAFSRKAVEATEGVKTPRYYFDFGQMMSQNESGYFPYTPSIPLLNGLNEALAILFEEGLDNVWARHHRLADGVRSAVEEWGFKRCCKEWRDASDTVTTVMLPEGVESSLLLNHAHRQYQLDLGAGLGELTNRAFRVGHLGALNEGMILGALGLIELSLSDLGVRLPFGSGTAAALRCWAEAE